MEPPSAHKESRASERCIDYLPTPSHGCMLITSRSTYAASQIVDANCHVAVDPMLSDEAVQLAEKKLGSEKDHEDIKTLVKELEYLPLAIAQAVAYVRQRSATWTVRRYLEKLQKNDKSRWSLLDRDEKDLRRDREARNSIRTWEISFEHIQKEHPSAAELLSLMSFFDRQAIPKEVLSQRTITPAERTDELDDGGSDCHSPGATNDLHNESDNVTDDSDDTVSDIMGEGLEQDLEMLRAYSFITVNEDLTMFGMHRLVQLATRTWLEANGHYDGWCLQFVQNLDDSFPNGSNNENWPRCKRLYPHAIMALGVNLANDDGMLKHASLMHKAAIYANTQLSKYNESELMLLRSVRYRKRVLGMQHAATLNSMDALALVYFKKGPLLRAKDLCEEVLDNMTQSYGEGSEMAQRTMVRLAIIHDALGQHDKAEELECKVLDMRRELYPQNDPIIWDFMLVLACTYKLQMRFDEAEVLLLDVLQRMKVVYGEHHQETLRPKEGLVALYREMRRLDEAEKFQVEVLALKNEMFGEHHLSTIEAWGSLAMLFARQGRLQDAERLQVKACAKARQLLGSSHVSTLDQTSNLAAVYNDLGRHDEAERLQLDVLEKRQQIFGNDHQDTLRSMSNLAYTYGLLGRNNEAEKLQHEVVATCQRTLGEDHQDTLTSMHNLAIYRSM
ncbi:Nephrocystin-3 [Pseudocercospora fuligena]|uniref:Nephrocystin-3 n=1 Tax=Pseudocercospora fuligena TaxID=685502 RepID=A0A8H6VLF7_9PEZI|nr:Nephrocystin-3 [Pseudocercospora fuligena]